MTVNFGRRWSHRGIPEVQKRKQIEKLAARGSEGANCEEYRVFQMDHDQRANYSATLDIQSKRALEEFSFSHRSFVSIIARVWLQKPVR